MKKLVRVLAIALVVVSVCSVATLAYTLYDNNVHNSNLNIFDKFVSNKDDVDYDISTGNLKKIVFAIVCSAENSELDYNSQYGYIENIKDGRGYTGGIIGFTSGTGDMLEVVKEYVRLKPNNNILAKYLPILEKVNGTDSTTGLGSAYEKDWKIASKDIEMIQAQNKILDEQYLQVALKYAKEDGLSILGQFIYYDALVVHGIGDDSESFGGIRNAAINECKTPAQNGDEKSYLLTFLDKRDKVMKSEDAHDDLSRTIAQRKFISENKYNLELPLNWEMYGDKFEITQGVLDTLK